MAVLQRTTPALITNTLFTQAALTSLGNGAYTAPDAVVTPAANATVLDFRLVLPSAITPAAGGVIALYLLPEVDGTNYPSPPGASAASPPARYYAGGYDLIGSAVTVLDILDMKCPDYPFKPLLFNNGSVAFPASGTFVASLYGKSWQWV